MITQIASAAIGTLIWAGMPARSSAAPMPTKSEMHMPVLAIRTAVVAKTDQRMPWFSRISSARPLPVTAPMRAASACTVASEMVMSTIIQSRS
jgi:hypothetical protein